MSRLPTYVVLIASFLPSIQATADTIAIQPVTGSGSYVTSLWSGSHGYQFRVNDPIAVTQLGAWDWLSNGISNSPVGIWTDSGSLLVQDEVTNSSPITGSTYSGPGFSGRFRFTTLNDSVLLTPGIYRIAVDYGGASVNSSDRYFRSDAGPPPAGPVEVDYIRRALYQSNGGNLEFPNILTTANAGFFGANFQFNAVHERHWVIGSGDFGVAGNWVEGAVPDAEDTLVLNESGAINRVINVTGARTVLAAEVGPGNYTIGADEVHLGTNSSAAADRLTIIDSLSITNGEFTATDLQVHSGSSFDINGGAATLGDLTIDSGGSFNFDDGTLTIDGGTITGYWTPGDFTAYLRGDLVSEGTATLRYVNGADQSVDANNFYVGNRADGVLDILSGSTFTAENELIIADREGDEGSVSVDGTGSQLDVGTVLHVGQQGDGTLLVTDGGLVTAERVLTGRGSTGLGEIVVSGDGSTLVANRLSLGGTAGDVASGGIGSLTISNAGHLQIANDTRIFDGSGLTINGGSVTTSDLTIDSGGSFNFDDGTLTIDGGTITNFRVDSSGDANIRGEPSMAGATATLNLENGASQGFDNFVFVGRQADGFLNVRSGSTVQVGADLLIAQTSGNDSAVTIDGVGSEITVTGATHVGNKGRGTLEITSGGMLTTDRVLAGRGTSGLQEGNILVDGTDSQLITNRLSLGGDELDVASGGIGRLTISSGGSVEIAQDVRVFAGTLSLIDGSLTADSMQMDSGSVFDFTGGTLKVDLFTGDLTQDGGLITIGNSPGTMTVDGNYTQSAGALEIELGGFNAGSEFDFLDISGTAILSGILDVSFWDGFLPEEHGDSFTFLEADGGVSGSFDLLNSTLPDLSHIAPYSSWAIQYGPNTVTLTVVPEPSSIALAGMGVVCGVVMATRRRLARCSNL